MLLYPLTNQLEAGIHRRGVDEKGHITGLSENNVIICIDYIQLHSLVRTYIIVTSAYAQSHLQMKFHTDLVNLIKRYSLSMIITEN